MLLGKILQLYLVVHLSLQSLYPNKLETSIAIIAIVLHELKLFED